eukprot:5915651-Pleurochrysis_carterae.AAC.1
MTQARLVCRDRLATLAAALPQAKVCTLSPSACRSWRQLLSPPLPHTMCMCEGGQGWKQRV